MNTTQDKDTFGYQWVRKSTGEFYRGIHKGDTEDGYAGSGTVFVKKFGGRYKTSCVDPDDWVRDVLFIGTYDECLLWESLVVTEREVENPKCLNLVVGGWHGKTLSEDTKRKLSEANKGRIVSDDTRRKLSESRKGKKLSKETKEKLSKLNKGENNPNYGKVRSEEHCRRISESKKKSGYVMSEETKRKISETKKAKHRQNLAGDAVA